MSSTLTAPAPTLVVNSTDYQNLVGQWSIYSNDEYGFSFEYPAIYDTQDFAICKPRQRKSEDTEFTVRLGARSYLSVLKEEKSLEEYIDDLTGQFATGDPDWQLQARTDTQVGGQDAITIEYRFGGLGRYGTATAVKNGDYLFVFNLTAGAFCDPPQTPGLEFGAYMHMIETFLFIAPGSAVLVNPAHWG